MRSRPENAVSFAEPTIPDRRGVVVLGSLNMDLAVTVPQIPRPGETVLGGPVTRRPGGKGANQAVAIARLGGDVHLIGRLGRDASADSIRSVLLDAGVGLTHVRSMDGVASGAAFVTVDARGENAIVVSSGANAMLTPGDVEAEADVLKQSRLAVAQLETPLAAVMRFAELCELYGVDLVLNVAPYQTLPPELIRRCAFLVLNQDEAAALTGVNFREPRDRFRALAAAGRLGAAAVVITLGGDGCVALIEDSFIELNAYEVTVVDTTGAGDAFVGGLATALSQNSDIEDALRFAAAVGAATCAQAGAQNHITSVEALRLLHEQPHLPRRTPASDLYPSTPSIQG